MTELSHVTLSARKVISWQGDGKGQVGSCLPSAVEITQVSGRSGLGASLYK